MNYYAKHARSLDSMQTRMGDSCPEFEWDDQTWKIIPGTAIRRADLSEGGIQLNADLRFEALVAQFLDDEIQNVTDLEEAFRNTPIGYLGQNYKVKSVGVRPGGLSVVVECNGADQGA